MISRRALELATATLTGVFGAAVIASSIDNGIGWSTAGVDAGTFPFLTGVIVLVGSLWNLARGWLQNSQHVAVSSSDLRRVIALFAPAVVFVAAIPLIGVYVASGCYMLGTLALLHRLSLQRSLLIATATPLALYLVFERMFQVSLPHGALGDVIGF
jgi:Tripartite tricarboxylate transporter TctB family